MNASEKARWRWDHVAKPLHSLGKLEDIIVQIADIQQTADVRIDKRCALVFCADHGVVAEGVSQSESEVTALVAKSIAEGTANINLMAAVSGTDVFAVDMGMVTDVPGVINRKVGYGTQNMVKGSAMTREQALKAMGAGSDLVGEMKAQGYQLIVTGEMGIGNTTAATALACALLKLPPQELVGRGAGLSDEGVVRKQRAIEQALHRNQPMIDPIDILTKVGGFEIAGMVGAFLGGVKYRIPIVIDGVISAVAALLAKGIDPEARRFMIASHMSRESAASCIMDELNLQPILHADMALGEGTGAVAILPLLDMALRVYHGPHTFEDLGMDAYTLREGQA